MSAAFSASAAQLKGTSEKVQELVERIEAVSAENEYERMQEAEFRDPNM